MNENIKKTNKNLKKEQEKAKSQKFKSQYFDYYDDVKSHTNKIVDW